LFGDLANLTALTSKRGIPGAAGGNSQAWTGIITGGVALVVHGAILIFYLVLIGIGAANH